MLLIMGCAFSRRSSRASRGANKGRRHSASSRAGWGCPRGRGHGDLNQLGVWKRRGRRRGTGKGSEGDSGGFCSRLARWAWPSVPLDGTVGGARSWARPASPLTTGAPWLSPKAVQLGEKPFSVPGLRTEWEAQCPGGAQRIAGAMRHWPARPWLSGAGRRVLAWECLPLASLLAPRSSGDHDGRPECPSRTADSCSLSLSLFGFLEQSHLFVFLL